VYQRYRPGSGSGGQMPGDGGEVLLN
jgi:hypothetical protein